MNAPETFVRVVNRVRYDVSKATLIASDCYWDGHNFERNGRNTFLYRTSNGRYFTVNLTQWQGEEDTLIPVSLEDAIDMFTYHLREHVDSFEKVFPTIEVVDA